MIYLGHISVFLPIASLLGIDDYFAMRIKAYTEVFNTSTGLSIGYLERLLTSMLVFLYYNKLNEVRKNNAVFINGLIAYFVMFFFFSEFQVLSKRFANLFAYGYWIIWIDLIKCFAIANNRRLFKAFIFIYCVMRMAGSTYLPDFAYDNILFGATSYQERLRIHDKTFEEPI
uniref:EpsG family protein n=4 Tax=unclassified Prevotella TaxID=2638335 RepID=A0AB33JK13_9BACT